MSGRSIHFVSLGCPKNRVDSEVMVAVAQNQGFTHTEDADEAEVIVVNTCGFINEAKRESIETILAMGRHKSAGSCKKLVVTGCLSQRYSGELAEDMPEVDHFLGSSDMLRLGAVLKDQAPRLYVGNPADWVIRATDPRTLSTRGASAYLKIAEGCNRRCGFCVIPQIRGKQRSRTIDDAVAEAEALVAKGVLELNLVSQDTMSYGKDRPGTGNLAALVARVADVPGVQWVRLHYLYPEKVDNRLLELMREHPKVVPYIDMPLQHAAPAMLRRMLRGGSTDLRKVVDRLRTGVPNAVLRTAFIVGHPGETQEEFEELESFIRWAQFDHVGVFQYSDEESCTSHNLADKVDADLMGERAEQLMLLQGGISKSKNDARVGQTLPVLVEGPSEESDLVMVGRHAGQAPDVDGVVYLSQGGLSDGPVMPGTLCTAKIVSATDYDLLAEVDASSGSFSSTGHSRPRVVRLKTVS